MLRLGVIGCGRVTTMFHLKAIRDVKEIKVNAVADVNEERMRALASEFGAKTYTDYRALLKDADIDSVAINTPPKFHERMVLDALKSGKNVLCEKPLSTTVQGCMRIKETQLESGLAVLPAHNYVFTPCLNRLIDLVNSRTINGVRKMTIAFENNLKLYRSMTDFRITSGNGVVEDILPHVISVSTLVTGSAIDVKELRWWCENYQVCDNMETTLVTEKGVDLECSLSWTKLVPKFSVEVHGYEGTLKADLMTKPYQVELKKRGKKKVYRDRWLSWYFDLVRFKHPSFRNQYIHFDRVVNGLEAPKITVDNEIRILEVMEKISEMM